MTFEIFGILGLFAFVIFSIWNIIEFRCLRKSFKANKKNNDGENLKRHFDLKYQIQYIISTGVLITIIFSFIGFSTKEDIDVYKRQIYSCCRL